MLNITSKIRLDDKVIRAPNITDRFTQDELDQIGRYCWEGYTADCRSRDEWVKRNEAGMNLAMQVAKAKSFPWPNASNIIFPLVSIAALQFSARAYSGIITAPDLVKYIILASNDDPEIVARAERLGRHMSFQLLEQDTAWEEQHDRLFINLSIVGTAFIKSRYDPNRRHNVGELVLARDLVVNYWAKDIASAPRVTQELELSRNDCVSLIREDAWKDVEEEEWFKCPPPPIPSQNPNQSEKDDRRGMDPNLQPDMATPLAFLEQHVDLDLDCDGYAEPWIITFEKSSRKVVRIVLNCDRPEDIERTSARGDIIRIRKTEYYTKYSFIPAPDGGFYDMGFGVLLGPLNEGVNTAINQLFDAGTMQNLGGGFLGRGAKMRGGSSRFQPGEWKSVDALGDDLRKSMVPLPTPEPSSVLFQLLGLLIDYTNQLSGATDMVMGRNPGQNTPAETSRNMLESGLQIYSTIFKRIWRSMKQEFRKYHILNRNFLPSRTLFGAEGYEIKREDYLVNPDWVRPAADPETISAAQRLNQAIYLREAAMTTGGGYNREEVERFYLRALRIQDIDTVFPGFEAIPPSEDPKVQIEKMRVQIETQEQELEQWKFIQEWQEAIRLNTAKIELLHAQVAGILADIQSTQAADARAALDAAIGTLVSHNEMLNERIRTTTDYMAKRAQARKAESDGKSGGKEKGGAGKKSGSSTRRVARVPTGGSAAPSARQMAGGDAGPVGFGEPGE